MEIFIKIWRTAANIRINFISAETITADSVGFGWLVDEVWACAKAELVMGVDT